ncbi:hypothetical protein LZK77_16160 [Rhizobium leguminosarum]|nr:hypothetical protein LZK77_16160 [Rhizobium leguminosarum]
MDDMELLRKNWIVGGAVAVTLMILGYLVFFEDTLSRTGLVKALKPDVQSGLYQTAVTGLLEQSSSFSNWSIALIAACWVVVVNNGKRSQIVLGVFVVVCGAALISLFLGQLIHQLIITDIRTGQDPLDNSWSWMVMTYQYRATLFAAVLVAGSIIWRHLND